MTLSLLQYEAALHLGDAVAMDEAQTQAHRLGFHITEDPDFKGRVIVLALLRG